MKNILLILAFLIGGFDAYGARVGGGTNARTSTGSASQSSTSTPGTSSGTVGARAAKTSGVRGRSGVTPTTPQKTTAVRGRSAMTPTTSVVKARAGTKQNVINSGTKVASATQNTVVDEECWNKFSGCMDSFCMLDNATGGRCICSDKNAEYDSILAEIQDLDNQSYQMATVGVERIEMGDDADAVMAKTKSITSSIEKDANKEKSKRRALDLSAWNNNSDSGFEEEVEDIFSLSADGVSVANKKGDALYRASVKLCSEQLKECSTQNKMMELMYQQRIRSDCSAYENSLRQQRTQSAQKLAAAQSAMREAALEQYRNANKYDLGQCTIEFKKCMQTTGGCGDDFTGCVTQQTTRETLQGGKVKMKKIKGASTTIEIAAWTYDALESKKPLCMTVTQQCVNVKDQVWDTFLREVAPQVKSAELAAESDLRMSCISTISDCFQKACKENMDPNNPDGSYDMCLTRPETLRSFCKVQIDPCEAAEPKIMDYVRARLASMRVDSCTKEFKECLQSEDRCGADYSQCVGLDTDTIVRMCPAEKLVGCQYDDAGSDGSARTNKSAQVKTDDEIYDELARIAQGIFLNIDNNMLTTCQKAADAAMIKVCGSTENCDDLVVDQNLGARSLEYKICNYVPSETTMDINYNQCRTNIDQITDAELGRNTVSIANKEGESTYTSNNRTPLAAVIDGVIYWDSVNISDEGNINTDNYFATVENDSSELPDGESRTKLTANQKQRVYNELSALQTSVRNAISAIESDSKVKACMEGRTFQGMRNKDGQLAKLGTRNKEEARYPNLTDQMRQIITNSALSKVKENYYTKYDELNEKMLKDYSKVAERIAEINGKNDKDNRREIARASCVNLADMSVLARSAEPPKSAGGKIIAGVAIIGAAVSIPLTGGASVVALGMTLPQLAIGSSAVAVAGIGLLGNAGSGSANGEQRDAINAALTGSKEMNQWNYKETITTTFDWENLICHKCVRATKCKETKNPLFGNKYCKEWEEPTETCNDTQF